ncbi:MAG: TolC family protein [Calditrichota bacterium]
MMLQKTGAILIALFLSFPAFGQTLDDYVREGIQSNLALQKENFSLEQSVEALKEARGLFLPSVSIEARYSRAGGGRDIEFPVGDLLNDVYSTLNQLTGTQNFPQLENVAIPFLREQEHETKVRVVQPLFQPGIYYNYKANQHLSNAQKDARDAFTRQLTADIKSAYFNYQKAGQVVTLLNNTTPVLEENLRVSKSLFDNGSRTQETVFRAEAELADLEQQIAEAERNRILAANYFNFLLNKPFDSPIANSDPEKLIFPNPIPVEEAYARAGEYREELKQLENAVKASGSSVGAAKSRFLPGVSLVFDYGFQGEEYRFTSDDDYWMGSAVLSWNLFNGGQDKAKLQKARLEKQSLQTTQQELGLQIRMQVDEAHQNLLVAGSAITSARKSLERNRKSFRIIEKKYANGLSPQIEFLDIRNRLTASEITYVVAQFDYQIRYAEYERITALNAS